MHKGLIASTVATWLLIGLPASAQEAPAPTIGEPADNGARIVAVEVFNDRVQDLTIESPSVGTVQTRLLLPEAFAAGGGEAFPVLYLLHGAGGQFDDWTQETDVGVITAGTDLLVAMPAAATTGLGTGEAKEGEDGPPHWETFHIVELPQLLERNWQASEQRLVAGLSLGGYGSVMYAARHPERFDAAASFSGVLDLTVLESDAPEAQELVAQIEEFVLAMGWEEANPINVIADLEGMPMYLSYGNGDPGPLDPPATDHDPLEDWVGRGSDNFVAALGEEDVAADVNDYGEGTHTWPYWERELDAAMPFLLESLDTDDE